MQAQGSESSGPGDGTRGQYFTFIEGLPPKEFTAWGLSPHMCWGGEKRKSRQKGKQCRHRGGSKGVQAGTGRGLGWAGDGSLGPAWGPDQAEA